MYNPYALLTTEILESMLQQPMYFVRQYYERGKTEFDEKGTIPLLLTHYIQQEPEKERAERHMRLLKTDPYRFLYNSSDPAHRFNLATAAQQPDGYRVYINLLPKKWKASDMMKTRIRHFLSHHFPSWQYTPAHKLKVTLKERYGKLYLRLLWKNQQTEVDLEQIENQSLCVMT